MTLQSPEYSQRSNLVAEAVNQAVDETWAKLNHKLDGFHKYGPLLDFTSLASDLFLLQPNRRQELSPYLVEETKQKVISDLKHRVDRPDEFLVHGAPARILFGSDISALGNSFWNSYLELIEGDKPTWDWFLTHARDFMILYPEHAGEIGLNEMELEEIKATIMLAGWEDETFLYESLMTVANLRIIKGDEAQGIINRIPIEKALQELNVWKGNALDGRMELRFANVALDLKTIFAPKVEVSSDGVVIE